MNPEHELISAIILCIAAFVMGFMFGLGAGERQAEKRFFKKWPAKGRSSEEIAERIKDMN